MNLFQFKSTEKVNIIKIMAAYYKPQSLENQLLSRKLLLRNKTNTYHATGIKWNAESIKAKMLT